MSTGSKILFTHSYFYRFDQKQWKIGQPYPPLMTITAAALMREQGFHVGLYDVGLRESVQDLDTVLDDFKPDYFVVFDDGFNYLTKMCLTTMREAAFDMQRKARAKGITVITCSSDSTDHYKKYLDKGANFVIRGEGEQTLEELIQALDQRTPFNKIPGIAYSEQDKVFTTAPRPVNKTLDNLPQAAWDLIDIEQYRQIWLERHGYFSLNLATTRGCPYKCNWCAKPIYGNRYNSRSPSKVADEVGFLNRTYQVDYFWMCDDIFGLKPNWVQEFRDELGKRSLKIKYKIQTRSDLLLKEDNIQALVESGLDTAWMGAESGSQEILDAMDKGTTIEQIRNSTALLKKHGVRVAFFLQFGYLGETKKDIDKTLDLVLDLMPDELGISVSYPLPGTKFYDKVKEDMLLKKNWVDSDDLDLMFNNTYHPSYYKKLHRYVHNRYRLKRGWLIFKHMLFKPLSLTLGDFKKVAALIYHVPMSVINGLILLRLSYKKA